MKTWLMPSLLLAAANAFATVSATVQITKIEVSLVDLSTPGGSPTSVLGAGGVGSMSEAWVSDQAAGFASASDSRTGLVDDSGVKLFPSFGTAVAQYTFADGAPVLGAWTTVIGAQPPNLFRNTMTTWSKARLVWGGDTGFMVPANARLQIKAFVELQANTTVGQGATYSDAEIAFASGTLSLDTPAGPASQTFGVSIWGGAPRTEQQASWIELSWDNLSASASRTWFSIEANADTSSNLLAVAVPEPSALFLLAAGLVPVLRRARSRRVA